MNKTDILVFILLVFGITLALYLMVMFVYADSSRSDWGSGDWWINCVKYMLDNGTELDKKPHDIPYKVTMCKFNA